MAHYAFLNEDNIVVDIIVGIHESELIDGKDPETWYGEFKGLRCLRTSYNTKNNQHLENGIPFRGNYAGFGYKYDEQLDAFIPPKPYDSWILDEEIFDWVAPVEYPSDGDDYIWNEEENGWILSNI